MNTRLIKLIREADSPRITVIGDIILDSYIQGDTNRISPEAPIQVLDVRDEHHAPGGAANVAANLKNLGAEVELCGVVGADPDGDRLMQMIEEQGIGCSAVMRDAKRPTINKMRVVAHNQQLVRIDREVRDTFDDSQQDRLWKGLRPVLERSDMIVFSDYAKGVLSAGMIQRIVKASKADILVDPKGKDFIRYRGCRLITPNRKEAEEATGIGLRESRDFERAARFLFDEIGHEELVITLGSDGIFYARKDGTSKQVPARARSVYDVTGAGDTVIASLAFCLAEGMDLDDAVRIANAAAGIVVGKLGVAAPARRELVEFFSSGVSPYADKILTQPEAAEAAGRIAERGENLVFTNGCFDLIHGGHVSYLRNAKGLGDYLMVGVNDDASVGRLKGPERPILPLEERMEILASLQVVDFVVPFTEDTPLELIQAVTPQVLIKGEDWREKGVVGREWVESHGGEVVLMPLRAGYSTSNVIERIFERHDRRPQ
ncbi:MAG: D-glycero-beta-D-manno-heptose-7-phosphate kinase [Planctomycetota bacterium]|jgi:D-beta-D-heptose 7-phosphate kinase/D-beta-D-heptose 1-phosphate adenosyltransferase